MTMFNYHKRYRPAPCPQPTGPRHPVELRHGHQPPPPLSSDVETILAGRPGGTPYPNGPHYVAADGGAEPGILASDIRWSANPVSSLNPLLTANPARSVKNEIAVALHVPGTGRVARDRRDLQEPARGKRRALSYQGHGIRLHGQAGTSGHRNSLGSN